MRGAIDAHLIDFSWMQLCPLLDVLREDPRFAPMRDEVGDRVRRIRQALRGD